MTLHPYNDPQPRGRAEYENWGNGRAPHWDDLDDETRAQWAARRTAAERDRFEQMPPAWAELIEALPILAKARTDDISPFHCSHDQLTVCADPSKLTTEEVERLEVLGFHADDDPDGGFYSYRYGSA